MTWVMAAHTCMGSMGEAVRPIFVMSLRSEKAAKELAQALQANLDRHGEYFVHAYEVPEAGRVAIPQVPAGQATAHLGRPAKSGEIAIDLVEMARKIAEYESFDITPELPDPEAEAAAIASLTGRAP